MRKNNKGFTLVEILAVIVILLIIVLIAAPNMTKEIKRGEDANQNVLNQKIENAAHLYAAKYYADKIVTCKSNEDNLCVSFSLNDLQQDGLINLNNSECTNNDENTTSNQYIEISYNSSESKIEYNYNNLKNLKNCYE